MLRPLPRYAESDGKEGAAKTWVREWRILTDVVSGHVSRAQSGVAQPGLYLSRIYRTDSAVLLGVMGRNELK